MAGRYPLPSGLAKTAKLMICLTPSEKAEIIRLAGLAGVSVSAFLVGQALGDRLGGLIKGEGFTASPLPNSSEKVSSDS